MRIQLSVPAAHAITALALLGTAPIAAQATLIKDINTVSSGNLGSRPTFPTYTYQPTFRTPSGLVLFVANRPGVGQELFFTFGVPSATQLLRDINPGPSNSFPSSFFGVGNTTFFYATTGNEGRELWRTDGTFGGTVLVKDIVPGPSGSAFGRDSTDFFDHGHGSMAALGSTVYLLLDGALGLYRSDGTAAGTTLVKALTPLPAHKGVDRPNVYLGSPVYTEVERRIVTVGNTLFFGADDGTGSGYELWKSDGTAAGTVRVKDINPGAAGSDPTGFFVHGGKLWFRCDDGTNGVELWTSDGTAAGTTLFKDINLGSVSSLPTQMTAVGSTIYFRANDGVTGEELWLTDGTPAGTRLVADLGGTSSFPTGFTPFGNQLLFGHHDDAAQGQPQQLRVPAAGRGQRSVLHRVRHDDRQGAVED
jgi:ELWxxDGT repeat protein